MKGRGGFGGGGGGMANIMRQANQMQNKMKALQEELAQREHEGSAGGGAVTVKFRGDQEIIAVQIKPEVLQGGDVEMLQDLVMTAVNDGLRKAKDVNAKEMQAVTGGFGLPF
jgi:DNA-binding YbaB/EbfC family protein